MSLTTEWRERLDAWLKELNNHFCISLGRLELEGFVTPQQLSGALVDRYLEIKESGQL